MDRRDAPRECATGENLVTHVAYVCPLCLRGLIFRSADGDASAGVLSCETDHSFPVAEGLPRFVQDEGYSASFGFQWQLHCATQLDSSTRTSLTRDRFFRGTGWPDRMEGETILEAGCGSGRFTEILTSTGAEICSFDYSRAAEVTASRFRNANLRVCQASIYQMPYRPASFDRVFCYGVLQHCPDVKAAFFSLARMVKPGGHLAVDVYDRRLLWFHSRYRVRWITRRMDKERLYSWCRKLVPLYMKIVPPLHPWNLLVVPLKDYRGVLPGLSREQEIEWSILDTFDFLSPRFDSPQSTRTMWAWCEQAGLCAIELSRGGNGIEVRARRPVAGQG